MSIVIPTFFRFLSNFFLFCRVFGGFRLEFELRNRDSDKGHSHSDKRRAANNAAVIYRLCDKRHKRRKKKIAACRCRAQLLDRHIPPRKAYRRGKNAEEQQISRDAYTLQMPQSFAVIPENHKRQHNDKRIEKQPPRHLKPAYSEFGNLLNQNRINRPQPNTEKYNQIACKTRFKRPRISEAYKKHADKRYFKTPFFICNTSFSVPNIFLTPPIPCARGVRSLFVLCAPRTFGG